MQKTTSLIRLLTIKRISELTELPVSTLRGILAENPQIRPVAIADFEPVFDRDAFLTLLSLADQQAADEEASR